MDNSSKVVIFDMDGVLACNKARLPHIRNETPDWEAFYRDMLADPVLKHGRDLYYLLKDLGFRMAILTNRPHKYFHETSVWLDKHGLKPNLLLMRAGLPYQEHKVYWAKRLSTAFKVLLAVDDDPANCSAFEEIGIPTIYVHSGYYLDGHTKDDHDKELLLNRREEK